MRSLRTFGLLVALLAFVGPAPAEVKTETVKFKSGDDDMASAFVAVPDPRGVPQSSVNNWGAGFLPAVFQGTPFNARHSSADTPADDATAVKATLSRGKHGPP